MFHRVPSSLMRWLIIAVLLANLPLLMAPLIRVRSGRQILWHGDSAALTPVAFGISIAVISELFFSYRACRASTNLRISALLVLIGTTLHYGAVLSGSAPPLPGSQVPTQDPPIVIDVTLSVVFFLASILNGGVMVISKEEAPYG